MKKEIRKFLANAGYAIEHRIKLLCGKPSPMKQFILVLVIGGAMWIGSFCILVDSIYKIGKNDARGEFPEVEHIRQLQLKNDSINLLKQQMYEYEQSGK